MSRCHSHSRVDRGASSSMRLDGRAAAGARPAPIAAATALSRPTRLEVGCACRRFSAAPARSLSAVRSVPNGNSEKRPRARASDACVERRPAGCADAHPGSGSSRRILPGALRLRSSSLLKARVGDVQAERRCTSAVGAAAQVRDAVFGDRRCRAGDAEWWCGRSSRRCSSVSSASLRARAAQRTGSSAPRAARAPWRRSCTGRRRR